MRFPVCAMAGALLLLAGCDDNDDPMAPETGTLEVEVTVTGDGTDEDGFQLQLDDASATHPVSPENPLTLEDVDSGDHSAELMDIADNCTVSGDNPRTVTVDPDATETVTFDVTCETSGS